MSEERQARPGTERRVLVLAAFALVAVASYALQRLWDARGEPPMGSVLVQATIPYYWRVGGAVVHGLVVGILAWFGTPEAALRGVLERLPWVVPLVVLPVAVAMAVVP